MLVPGKGLFGLGASAKDAAIAADIAENTIEVITDAEAAGGYQPISEADMFDVEYWSLEQAKLGKAAEKPLARQAAVVTGGGSGIGAATAKALARAGAEIAVLDRDRAAASFVARDCGRTAIALECDVTKLDSVKSAFDQVAKAFGGVDIYVSNAARRLYKDFFETTNDDAVMQGTEFHECLLPVTPASSTNAAPVG